MMTYALKCRTERLHRNPPPATLPHATLPRNTTLFDTDGRDPSLLLRSVVPVLEGAVSFFLDYMILADDGQGAIDGT